jgi:hypothetical protein
MVICGVVAQYGIHKFHLQTKPLKSSGHSQIQRATYHIHNVVDKRNRYSFLALLDGLLLLTSGLSIFIVVFLLLIITTSTSVATSQHGGWHFQLFLRAPANVLGVLSQIAQLLKKLMKVDK